MIDLYEDFAIKQNKQDAHADKLTPLYIARQTSPVAGSLPVALKY